ncbi:uncharacterized protein LOC119643109, partial [Glossina fuscipes]|uniref:RNA-directed DNA polymerase n=1 Tax=Glossina fuscipes TaxID=7396 RepID=A0A9C6DZM7_9MUSC
METKYAARMLQLPEGTMRGASPKRQVQEHISCGAAMDRICKWSVRYDGEGGALEFIARVEELCEVYDLPTDIMPRIIMELLHGKAAICKDLSEMIALGERFEDIPAPATAPPMRETTGIRQQSGGNAPFMSSTNNAGRNVCHRCALPGHLARDCRNPRVLFCWDCGRQGVLTKNCCRQYAEQHPQARGMTAKESPGLEKPPIAATSKVLGMRGSTLVASLSVGGLPTTSVIDTGATRSIIREDAAECIPWITRSDTQSHSIRMADGTTQSSLRTITVEIRLGVNAATLELLVVKRGVDHLTLGIDFLAEIGTAMTIGDEVVKLSRPKIPLSGTTSDPHPANGPPEMARGPTAIQATDSGKATQPPRTNRSATHRRSGAQQIAKEHKAPSNPTMINAECEAEIQRFIEKEFSKFNSPTVSNIAYHYIRMKDEIPIKLRYHRKNPAMQAIIDREVDKLIEAGCIEPSNSPYSAPIVVVPKRNGEWRLCMDYRVLNSRSIPDAYPLPRIEQILDKLRQARCISTIDLKNGYWQIPIHPSCKKYTAFTVPGRGLYQWRVMPFGLHSAPATFQRALDRVIGPEMDPFAFAYLDDIIVISKSASEQQQHLQRVFERLRSANLAVNKDKCKFFQRELQYLGHLVTAGGISTDPEKVSAIRSLKPPNNLRELRRCLGTASWYRRFVSDYTETIHPLSQLLKKKTRWVWGEPQQKAFDELKRKLTEAP